MVHSSKLGRFSPTNARLASRYRHHATRSGYWHGKRSKIIISIVLPFFIIQSLFLGLQAYIFGSASGSASRVHNLHVLAVDFDGGIVGDSLRAAYELLESPQMLGLRWEDASQYPDPASVYDAVYRGQEWWGGIFVYEGATDRLADAIGDNNKAQVYNASQVLGTIYNGARYPDFADAYVAAGLEQLVAATRLAYNKINGTKALKSIPKGDTASMAVVLDPIEATNRNIKPVNNGVRVFYNTAGQVFTILLQFFFLMAFNTMLTDWSLDSRLPVKHHVILRIVISTFYTFVGSLLVAANIYAFRGDASWSGAQVVLLWMAFWLEMHVLFLVLEITTTFLQLPFLPLFIVTFIIMNITSSILPFELSPGFYRWGSALPCRNLYQLEITIMSGGANNSLDVALPVLFAWWILCLPLAFFSLVWRCNKAAEADKEMTELIKADQERTSNGDLVHVRLRRQELDLVIRRAQSAARDTYGLGFPAMTRFNTMYHLPELEAEADDRTASNSLQ